MTLDLPTAPFSRAKQTARMPAMDRAALRAALDAADPALLRQIEALPTAQADLALRMFDGGSVFRRVNPDEIARSRLLAEGGPDMLVAAQRYQDDFAGPASAIGMATDMPPRALATFSADALRRGSPFVRAWRTQILPNWKPLAAAGLLSGCVAASETCIDAAGNLTGHVAETLAAVVTTAAAEAVTGAAKGVGETVIAQMKGPNGLWFILGTLALLIMLAATRGLWMAAIRVARFASPMRIFARCGKRRNAPIAPKLRDRNIR